jgi:hypothetical protein
LSSQVLCERTRNLGDFQTFDKLIAKAGVGKSRAAARCGCSIKQTVMVQNVLLAERGYLLDPP